MSKRNSRPAWGNASSDPTRPLVLPLNRAARQRYARSKGVTLAEVPALNKPMRNPEKTAKILRMAEEFMEENKELMQDLADEEAKVDRKD